MDQQLQLDLTEFAPGDFLKVCAEWSQAGLRDVLLRPFNDFAMALVAEATAAQLPLVFHADASTAEVPLSAEVASWTNDQTVDGTILCKSDAATLSRWLMEYLDLESGRLLAPITEHYFRRRPLFLISIPKSGTHLLYQLVKQFGYDAAVVCNDQPSPGAWYCVEFSNSHTSARDFFLDSVRRGPFGNRDHPFLHSPAVFIYRNPMDIVASEAQYYHRDGKTAFAGYLSGLSAEERLMTLIDDPWLLGTARERIGAFVPWLDLPNVAPVSFEELVGVAGGGDDQSQLRVIWSLQLKLHIPGNPRAFGNAVFDRSSPTFNEGQIGAYRKHFSAAAYQSFNAQAVDLMERFGYTADAGDLAVPPDRGLPRHRQRYLKRPLRMMAADFSQTPILIEQGVLGHNLVKLGGRYAVIPHSLGPVDLRATERALPEGIHWFDHLDEAHAWLTCSILPPPPAVTIEDAESAPAAVPLLLIESLWGRNFVKYGQRFFALRQSDGPVDVVVLSEQMDSGQAGALASCVHESLLAALVASARELEAEQQVVPVDSTVVEPVQPELLAGLCEHVGRQQLAILEMRAEIIHLKQTLWSNLRPKLRGTASDRGKREDEERAA